MATAVEWAAVSVLGSYHSVNQDRFALDGTLFCLADGMGGPGGGHVAATVAVRSLMASRPEDADSLAAAVARAGHAVRAAALGEPGRPGMGTTITAVLVTGDGLLVAAVGDTRCYVEAGGDPRQVTVDDTLARALDVGPADPGYARATATLTRHLGGPEEVEVDVLTVPVEVPTNVVLSTDGVHEHVALGDLARGERASADDHAMYLVAAATAAGSADDATALVLLVEP